MAKNFSCTSEGIEEFGSSPNSYFTPNPPKYDPTVILPVLAGGILDKFSNTSAYTGEALALKVLEEGGPFYSMGSNVKELIEQDIVQLSADYILEILSDGGPFVSDVGGSEKLLSDINVALKLLKELEENTIKRATEIGIDEAEEEIIIRPLYSDTWLEMVELTTSSE